MLQCLNLCVATLRSKGSVVRSGRGLNLTESRKKGALPAGARAICLSDRRHGAGQASLNRVPNRRAHENDYEALIASTRPCCRPKWKSSMSEATPSLDLML